MRDPIFCDRRELRRIEYTIASLETRHGSVLLNDGLLKALKAERDELLRLSRRPVHGLGARHAA
jgi:hypothetical protein